MPTYRIDSVIKMPRIFFAEDIEEANEILKTWVEQIELVECIENDTNTILTTCSFCKNEQEIKPVLGWCCRFCGSSLYWW